MTAAAVVACVALTPTPTDYLTAHADLTAPVGVPPLAERSPRTRIAALIALHHLGGLDADAPETFRWFDPGIGWQSEHDCARRVVAAVAACPTLDEGWWVPPRGWFRAESDAYFDCAARWRKRAEEYRERAVWESWREEPLTAWARHFDAQADVYAGLGCRLNGWAGANWNMPRRVVLRECREWIGESAWERREFPGW